jgi:hypothetical protein
LRAAWIIAVREVREKARLFLICAALAVVPFAATLLPGAGGDPALTIAVVGGFLAAILGLGIAATFGASTIARDLSERRMSFYFTKPVSAPAIWAGKAVAALFISLGCAAIIAGPAVLASKKQWAMHWLGDVQPLAALAIGIVMTFFLAHVLSSVIRSRSPLLALDFLFLIVAAGAVYFMVVPLVLGGAADLVKYFAIALAAALLLVLAIAPVWQLANGRSDIRRSHAALMRFLWPAIGVVLLIAGGVVAWVVHVQPEDVEVWHIEQARRGPRIMVMGGARNRLDYRAAFLIDRTTGSFTRIAAPLWSGAQFSDDGRVAVWLQGLELHTTDGATNITVPASAGLLLSGDGKRVAVTNGSLLSVYDLASGKLLASAAGLDSRARQQLFFVTPDLVRVIEHGSRTDVPTPLRVFELDVRARKTRKTGERMILAQRYPVAVSRDGSRMFIRGLNVIADGRTAETIAQLSAPGLKVSEMLNDGRVAIVEREGEVVHLRTFERDGTPRHVVPFPGVRAIWIAGETESGKLILAAYGRTMWVVDLARGVVEKSVPGVRGPLPRWGAVDPRLIRYEGELAGVDSNGKLVAWKSEGRTAVRPLLQSR